MDGIYRVPFGPRCCVVGGRGGSDGVLLWTTEIIDVKQIWGRNLRARDFGSVYMDEAHAQHMDGRSNR